VLQQEQEPRTRTQQKKTNKKGNFILFYLSELARKRRKKTQTLALKAKKSSTVLCVTKCL
jgi:hypothetical protein